MMTEELDILKIISENPEISQRKIAERAGISLGQVNFLIKKCVKKGLVKIEGQTSKSIRYNLTPKGFSEKASLTLDYIQLSCAAVINLTNKIRTQVEQYKNLGNAIYVYGSNDELMEICKIALGSHGVYYVLSTDCMPEFESNGVVFYWEENHEASFKLAGVKAVNLLI